MHPLQARLRLQTLTISRQQMQISRGRVVAIRMIKVEAMGADMDGEDEDE